jgi:hypothetical protein
VEIDLTAHTVSGIMGVLIGSGGTFVLAYLQARHKRNQETHSTTIAEWQQIADRQEKQIARLEQQIDEMQTAIHHLYGAFNASQVEISDLHGWCARIRDLAVRQAMSLEQHGDKPETIPELPPRKQSYPLDPHFLTRTVEQDVLLAQHLGQQLKQHLRPSENEVKP